MLGLCKTKSLQKISQEKKKKSLPKKFLKRKRKKAFTKNQVERRMASGKKNDFAIGFCARMQL